MSGSGVGGLPRRAVALLAAGGLALVFAPVYASEYVLSVLLVTLYFAYVGQAWNIMMGFAGQLSLGHSLYVGLGAYASAALFVHFGVSPWLGLFAGMIVAAAAGGLIGFLGFRFGIMGVYFALLTIAFAELTRILFEHFQWVGATAGFFLPVANREADDWLNLRGGPVMFYYLVLGLTAGALGLSRLILRSRLGYYWRAIREDQQAAETLGIPVFRYKMIAVMLSAAMTALGGVFFAFYYNNLFPSQVFAMHRSIEMILAPIIGGLGTLVGPVLGAFLLTPLGEAVTALTEGHGLALPGIKQLVYGVVLLLIIKFLPGGVWPALARRLGLDGEEAR
jgi:branched-chain amino acid transport system permease protein